MKDSKWKDYLLRSSLPLEHSVAELLAEQDWSVWGQYSYARKNENGLPTDFSADVRASKEYSNDTHWLAMLDVLIECKYASPGVKWVFLPYPETTTLFSGAVKVFDEAANKRVTNRTPIEAFEESIDYCIRGVALHDSGCDENAISRGAFQLRYAMPRIAEQTYSAHARDLHDEDIAITFACAILVTTAPLLCLKPGMTLAQVFAAEKLEDVTDPKDHVILWEEPSPDFLDYVGNICKDALNDGLSERLNKYRDVFKPSKQIKFAPGSDAVWHALRQAGSHVIVTTLDRLGGVLEELDAAAEACVPGIKKIAEVRFDPEKREGIISRLKRNI